MLAEFGHGASIAGVCYRGSWHLLLAEVSSAARLGLFCSPHLLLGRVVVVCAVPISIHPHTLQVSYTASGSQFEDRERFPRLYTLQTLVFSYNEAYVHFITSFGWRRVAIIFQVDPLFSAVSPVGVWVGECLCCVQDLEPCRSVSCE